MSEKPTAHNAERLVLSCLMRGGQAVRTGIRKMMEPRMFDRYRETAEAAWELSEDVRPDPDSVKGKMEGSTDQVDKITEVSPTPKTWKDHAPDVMQSWSERDDLSLSEKIRKSALGKSGKTFDYSDHDWMDTKALIEEHIDKQTRALDSAEDTDLRSTVQSVLTELEEAQAQGTTGIPTGFPSLDSITDGWQDAEVTVIAGRPSMGKTSFALSQAIQASVDGDLNSRIHSLEMSRQKLVKRMIAQQSKVNVRDRPISDDGWQRITRSAGKVSEATLTIDDQPTITPRQVRTRCRQQIHKEGLDVLIIDYLQLLRPPRDANYSNRNKEVGSIARSLKMIAKDLDIPVLALAQLNRKVENRNPPRPQMADLRDSGEIEEHADNILFLYRPEVYGITTDPQGNDTTGMGEIVVSKQRNGPDGRVRAAWVEKCAAWEPLEKRQTESPVGGDGLAPRQDAGF